MTDSLERAKTFHGRSSSAGSRGLVKVGTSAKSLALPIESLRTGLEVGAVLPNGTLSGARVLVGREARDEGCEG